MTFFTEFWSVFRKVLDDYQNCCINSILLSRGRNCYKLSSQYLSKDKQIFSATLLILVTLMILHVSFYQQCPRGKENVDNIEVSLKILQLTSDD